MVKAEKGLLPQAANGPSFFPAEFEWDSKQVVPMVMVGVVDPEGKILNTVEVDGNLTALPVADPPTAIIPPATVLTVSGGATPTVISSAIDMSDWESLYLVLDIDGPSTDVDVRLRDRTTDFNLQKPALEDAATELVFIMSAVSPAAGSADIALVIPDIGGGIYELYIDNDDAVNEATVTLAQVTRFNRRHA